MGKPGRTMTVVGVAADAYYGGFRNSGHPALVFLPSLSMSDETAGYPTIYVHSTDAAHIGPDVRRALAEVDSRVPITRLRSLDSDLSDISWMSRVMTRLLSFFALGSLLIAALGQYAAMAFAAQRRTRELAIRLALGASGRQVAGEVLGTGMKLTAAGLLIGLSLGSLAGRLRIRSASVR
jgi:ABC-type antimicrobial peptide transport system permease subunit